jgi:hypothetical protein
MELHSREGCDASTKRKLSKTSKSRMKGGGEGEAPMAVRSDEKQEPWMGIEQGGNKPFERHARKPV